MTPANGFPKDGTYRTWTRSHGDNGGTRYSALQRINRQNVTNLQVAWTYHTGDAGKGTTIECTPIVIGGVMFVTTPTCRVVALDADTGRERWKYDPKGHTLAPYPFGGTLAATQ